MQILRLTGTALLLAFGGHAAAQTADDEAAIREIPVRVAAAETEGNVEALVTLWTEDGMLMEPGQPSSVGTEAMRTYW